MATMDSFLSSSGTYPRRLASLSKNSSLAASTKQYTAQFRRPSHESPGDAMHTAFLDDLDAEINQELSQFRKGQNWQHGTKQKKQKSSRHGLVLENVQPAEGALASADLGTYASPKRTPTSATQRAVVKAPSRPLGQSGSARPNRGHLSPLANKRFGITQNNHVHYITLLKNYYEALHPDRYQGSFANLEEHFEALLHDDVRINTAKRTYSKQDWRCILTDMVSNGVMAKNFIVRNYGDDYVTYCLTLMIAGNVSYPKSKATFKQGKCILIEPYAGVDGRNQALHTGVLEAFFRALDPAQHANAFENFEGVYNSLVHDRFTYKADKEVSNKADWTAYWQRLVEGGVLARNLAVHYSEGDVAGYSVKLDVGVTSMTMHDTATFEDGKIVAIEPLDPSALHRLAMATKPAKKSSFRSPGARAIRKQSLETDPARSPAQRPVKAAPPPYLKESKPVRGPQALPKASEQEEEVLPAKPPSAAPCLQLQQQPRPQPTAEGKGFGTLLDRVPEDRMPLGLAALKQSRTVAPRPQPTAPAPYLGAHRGAYVARTRLRVLAPSPAPREPAAPRGPMAGVARLLSAAGGAELRGLKSLGLAPQAGDGLPDALGLLAAAAPTPQPNGIALLVEAAAPAPALGAPRQSGMALLCAAAAPLPGSRPGLRALDRARALRERAPAPRAEAAPRDGVARLLNAAAATAGHKTGLVLLARAHARDKAPALRAEAAPRDGVAPLLNAAAATAGHKTGLVLLAQAHAQGPGAADGLALLRGAAAVVAGPQVGLAALGRARTPSPRPIDAVALLFTASAASAGDRAGLDLLAQARARSAAGPYAHLSMVMTAAAADDTCAHLRLLRIAISAEAPKAARSDRPAFAGLADLMALVAADGHALPSLALCARSAGLTAALASADRPAAAKTTGAAVTAPASGEYEGLSKILTAAAGSDRECVYLAKIGLCAGLGSGAAPPTVGRPFGAISVVLGCASQAGVTVPSLMMLAQSVSLPVPESPQPVAREAGAGAIEKLLHAASREGPPRAPGLAMLQHLSQHRPGRPASRGVFSLMLGARAVELENADGLVMLRQLTARSMGSV